MFKLQKKAAVYCKWCTNRDRKGQKRQKKDGKGQEKTEEKDGKRSHFTTNPACTAIVVANTGAIANPTNVNCHPLTTAHTCPTPNIGTTTKNCSSVRGSDCQPHDHYTKRQYNQQLPVD
jgi:hypothetical protein